MRLGLKWMVALVLLVALLADGRAGALRPGSQPDNTVSSGPYKAILDRNVFDLRDPPPPPALQAPPTPMPNVKLVGLMILSGIPQAVLAISEPDTVGKPPVSHIMAENQREAGVEVKEINYTAKTAKVIMGENGENVAVLKLEEPRQMAPGGVMVGGPGGGRPFPNRPGFVPGQAPQMPGAYNPGAYNPGSAYSPSADAGAGAGYGGAGGMGESSIPTRPVRSEPQISAEQQTANMEAQRQQLLQENSPIAGLIPFTPATPPQAIQQTHLLMGEQGANPNQPQQENSTGTGTGSGSGTSPQQLVPSFARPTGTGTLR